MGGALHKNYLKTPFLCRNGILCAEQLILNKLIGVKKRKEAEVDLTDYTSGGVVANYISNYS